MRLLRRIHRALTLRLTPWEWKVFKVQMALLFAISTLLYLGFPGTREWRRLAEENQAQTLIRGWDGLAWYVWVGSAPLMLMLIRRYPLTRDQFRQNCGRIVIGSVALYLAVTHARYFLHELPLIWWAPRGSWPMNLDTYVNDTIAMLPLDFLTFSGFFAVSFAVDYYFENRLRLDAAAQLQLQAERLQTALTRAELAALRSQLHPHFLFNSFNALATLVRQRKNDEAVEIIAQLSALLRLAIDRTGVEQITIEQEFDFIRRYLAIEQVRFGEKLRVSVEMDPDALEALVPNIVLQPLVENAIKHGIAQRTDPGTVRLAVARSGNRLRIEISNDGPDNLPSAEKKAGSKPAGIGLSNARAQLDRTYGSDYRLEILKSITGGAMVTLDLPWRQRPGPEIS